MLSEKSTGTWLERRSGPGKERSRKNRRKPEKQTCQEKNTVHVVDRTKQRGVKAKVKLEGDIWGQKEIEKQQSRKAGDVRGS